MQVSTRGAFRCKVVTPAVRTPEPSPPPPSLHLGPYRLLRCIAQGGMGEVHLATLEREAGFRKLVAVKRALPHLANDPSVVSRFEREARLAAVLTHRHIVQVFDFGRADGAAWLAMEYVHGVDLKAAQDRLGPQPLPAGLAVEIGLACARGLHHAHGVTDAAGEPLHLVHRDVSPHNVLLSFDGDVKLTDFGLADAATGPERPDGMIQGKYAYMSPEQARGGAVDARSDQLFARRRALRAAQRGAGVPGARGAHGHPGPRGRRAAAAAAERVRGCRGPRPRGRARHAVVARRAVSRHAGVRGRAPHRRRGRGHRHRRAPPWRSGWPSSFRSLADRPWCRPRWSCTRARPLRTPRIAGSASPPPGAAVVHSTGLEATLDASRARGVERRSGPARARDGDLGRGRRPALDEGRSATGPSGARGTWAAALLLGAGALTYGLTRPSPPETFDASEASAAATPASSIAAASAVVAAATPASSIAAAEPTPRRRPLSIAAAAPGSPTAARFRHRGRRRVDARLVDRRVPSHRRRVQPGCRGLRRPGADLCRGRARGRGRAPGHRGGPADPRRRRPDERVTGRGRSPRRRPRAPPPRTPPRP